MELILERFRLLGHSVSLIEPETALPAKLDAGILHVAATRVPVEVLSRLPAGLPIVNRQVLDISKRRVSSLLVNANDSVSGPVIVKSDANYAGQNDFERLARWRRRIRRITYFLRHGTPRPHAIPYEIYPSVSDVPRRVWANPERVVERFIPESVDGLYCLRKWVFLGDAELQVISLADGPIVKAGSARHTFVHDPVPPELVRERIRLGFNYGKFDYVMHAGRAILLDANSTPGISARSPQLYACADQLALGLQKWVVAQYNEAAAEAVTN
jgi:hypothetical protein